MSSDITRHGIDKTSTQKILFYITPTEAQIKFDRFHVVKLLKEAMDNVRKAERKEHDLLKSHKYMFLKNPDHLSNHQRLALVGMIML